jgi:hypothetical protein
MLDKIYRLTKSLKSKGLLAGMKDSLIRTAGDSTPVVRLDGNGDAISVRLSGQRVAFIYLDGHNLFPVFNLAQLVTPPVGFSASTNDLSWLDGVGSWRFCSESCEKLVINWYDVPARLLKEYKNVPNFPPAVLRLMNLMSKENKRTPDVLAKMLLDQFILAAKSSPDTLPSILRFFGLKEAKKEKVFRPFTEKEIEVGLANKGKILVEDDDDIRAEETWAAVSQAMSEKTDEGFPGICALTGKQGVCALTHRIFQVPTFGSFQVFSVNKETPASHPYGLSQGRVFPVLTEVAKDMTRAIQYLWNEESKNKTWGTIPSTPSKKGKKGADDVMLAWIDDDPTISAVSLFDSSVDPEVEDCDFKSRTDKVFAALTQRLSGDVDPMVNILLIRKADKANFISPFDGNFRTSEIKKAVDEWTAAADGLSPRDCISLLWEEWVRLGTEKQPAMSHFSMVDIYSVYLKLQDHETTEREMLRCLVRSHGELIVAARHDGKKSPRVQSAGNALKMIWLLLSKQGIGKEQGMQTTAWKMGRVLYYLDHIQREWSMGVHKKRVPVTVAEDAISLAVRNPLRAYNHVTSRCEAYLSWARSNKENSIGSLLKSLGDLTDEGFILGLSSKSLSAVDEALLRAGFISSEKEKEGDQTKV